MENANNYEYLEKIKIAVIENLKRTAPVPSVQMQDVPRTGFGMSDEQEDELDDLDEDENKDVRTSQRQWDQNVQRQNEYEDSDDEDMAQANGVYKPNGRTRLNIMDYQNPNAVDDDMEIDSGMGTPAAKANEPAAENDETMMEDAEPEPQPASAAASASVAPQAAIEADKVDDDGDVDMAEPEDKAAEATIKTEEVDGASGPPPEHKKTPAAGVTNSSGDGEAAGDAGAAKVGDETAPVEEKKEATEAPPA
jgi:histone deacetylase 1/2